MICTGSQAQTVNVFTVRKAGFKNRKTFYGSFTVRLRFVYGSQKFNQKGNLLGLPGLRTGGGHRLVAPHGASPPAHPLAAPPSPRRAGGPTAP